MAGTARWTMSVVLEEDNGTTRATVRLGDDRGNHFDGIGVTRQGVDIARVAGIAGELALARALSDLTEELLSAVASDIEASLDMALTTTPALR